jgi:two-component system CitB family response regulator
MISTLVVDDDFRVADLHARFVRSIPGFEVVGVAHSAGEALSEARHRRPCLTLLDLYLPDRSGLEIVPELHCDVIMLTAANDAASVRAAFGHGVVNYLIKPFGLQDLADRLAAYARYSRHLGADRALEQSEIDRAATLLHDGDLLDGGMRKGRSSQTAARIVEVLRDAERPLSAADVAGEVGVSRATAQRYLSDLVDTGRAGMSLRYGATGRPEHRYAWRQDPVVHRRLR